MMARIKLTLPLPPSANRLWRMDRAQGFMRKSRKAKEYYKLVSWEARLKGIEPLDGDVIVVLQVYRAQRSGDLDNKIKPLLDALQGVAFHDDKQVIEIHAFRYDDKDNPRVEVVIKGV
jgi:crossover junction endodeoxyribonuclease RusA